ncbi:MAG: DUF3108 domain-containing protein [Dehalococcoidia bacterium]|nr:DUF3108 domain-containing protein [Dehalococcoidia bacterium]
MTSIVSRLVRGPASLALALLVLGAVPLVALGCGNSSSADVETTPIVGTVPFADGERLTYELRDDRGVLGHGVLTVTREGNEFVLKQDYEEATTPEGATATSDRSTSRVDVATLQPHSVERTVQGRDDTTEYAAEYSDDGSSVRLSRDGGHERDVKLPEYSYENESSLWLWRSLDLAEGYKSKYVSVNLVERTRQTVALEVTGRQRTTVPAGTFDTWRLQIRNGRATRVVWVNVDAPHQVIQWDNGDVVFRLEPNR